MTVAPISTTHRREYLLVFHLLDKHPSNPVFGFSQPIPPTNVWHLLPYPLSFVTDDSLGKLCHLIQQNR
jgi:hypothetical protein